MNNKKSQALALREQGYSYELIHQKTGIARSTMSYWFRNIPFEPNAEVRNRIKNSSRKAGAVRHQRRLEDIRRQLDSGMSDIGRLSTRDMWMIGLGLYIGEGAKTTEQTRIANSDPNVIRLCMAWLRGLGVPDKHITLSVHAYPDNDAEACKVYWLKTSGLTDACFGWVSIDKRGGKRRQAAGKLPYGTAHIIVRARGERKFGVQLFRRINGWIQAVYNQV